MARVTTLPKVINRGGRVGARTKSSGFLLFRKPGPAMEIFVLFVCFVLFYTRSTSPTEFWVWECVFKDIFSQLHILLLKPYPHSKRVRYLHETNIAFHCNDNIFSAAKHLLDLEDTGNHFCSCLYLLSFYEFCVSDESFIIWLLQYLSQREIRSLSHCFQNIQKVPTVRFRRNESDINILQIMKTQQQKR